MKQAKRRPVSTAYKLQKEKRGLEFIVRLSHLMWDLKSVIARESK